MQPTRRTFLKSSVALGGLVSWGPTIPVFLSRTAAATPDAGKKGSKDTILVVVQLTGGNDGLNTVIPYADAEYGKLRKALRIPLSQIKKIDDHVGLHPSLHGLANLLEDQALCVVQGVGYPNPSQSHFRSMDIWQAGSTADPLAEGWIGRALKQLPNPPAFHLAEREESAPLALTGAPVRVPSITSLQDFQLRVTASSKTDKNQQREVIEGVIQQRASTPGMLDFVNRTAANTYASSRRLQEIGKSYQPRVPYPNSALASRLRLAAQLIDADIGARIFYVSLDGFDTHANQILTHGELLRQLSDAMVAFYKDLAARGHKDRTLMMTFSEFGRRAKENGSRGTDHGSAAPVLLVGGKVKAGTVGKHPSLTDLEQGNLRHHTDFRQVYAAILDHWLGVSSKDVLGRAFPAASIFTA